MSIVRFSLLLIFILYSLSAMSQHGPVVGERTYKVIRQISTDTGTGSASLLNIEDRLYVLTVRHLFKKTIRSGDRVTLDFIQNERPVKVIGHILLHENDGIDMALIDIGPADPSINGFDVRV